MQCVVHVGFRYSKEPQVSRNFTFAQSATDKLGRDKCLIIYALENGKDIVEVVHGKKKKNVCGGRKENYYTGC